MSSTVPVIQHATPLEPRIMLDANLEWDLSGTAALGTAVAGITQAFSEQIEDIDALLSDLSEAAQAAVAPVVAIVSGPDGDDLAPVAAAIDRFRTALDEVRNSVFDTVGGLVDGPFADTVASAANTRFGGGAGTLTGEDLAAVFSVDGFAAGNLAGQLETLLAGEDTGTVSVNEAIDILLEEASAAFGLGAAFSVALRDVEVGGAAVVEFTQDTASRVGVEVIFPEIVADFAESLAGAIPGFVLPFDLAGGGGTATTGTFVVESLAEITGGTLDRIGVNIADIALPALIDFDASVTLPAAADLSLGFLDLRATTLDTLAFRITPDLGAGANIGGAISFAGALPAFESFASELAPSAALSVRPIGAAAYMAHDSATRYDLVALGIDGALDFAGANQTFSGAIKLVTDPTGAVPLMLDFDIAPTGGRLTDAQKEALERSVQALSQVGPEHLVVFLGDVRTLVPDILGNDLFAVEIPFTDLTIANLVDDIVAQFDEIAGRFQIDPAALGFLPTTEPQTLQSQVLQQDSRAFDAAALDAFTNIEALTLQVFRINGEVEKVDVDLSTSVLRDATKSVAERVDSLVALLNSELLSHAVKVERLGTNALRVIAEEPRAIGDLEPATFGLKSVRRDGGTVDTDVSLDLLGFGAGAVAERVSETDLDVVIRINGTDSAFALAPLDFDALRGVKELRYTLSVDGVDRVIQLENATGWASVGSLAADLNAAFDAAGIGATVVGTAVEEGATLAFLLDDGETRALTLQPQSDPILAAVTLEGLVDWVNTELAAVLPGAELALTDAAALEFRLPGLAASVSVGAGDGVRLSLADLGLGELSGLTLDAALTAEIGGTLNTGFGIDLAALSDRLSVGVDNATSAITDAVLQSVFFTELDLSADIEAAARGITGVADLGLLTVEIGRDDPDANFAAISAQVEANFVGRDPDTGYSQRISFDNLAPFVQPAYEVSGPALIEQPNTGLASLLGRFDLAGGIVTDGTGQAIAAGGAPAQSDADIRIEDADLYSGTDPLAQLAVRLGDVAIDVAGLTGVNEGIVDGLSLTIDNLASPIDTLHWQLLSDDPVALDALRNLANLGSGDILDSLSAVAEILVIVGETLSDTLPFLAADIPLLNFSILDQLDFASDFLAKLQQIQQTPQDSLNTVQGLLEDVFGADTVSLAWDGAESTLDLGLSFTLLDAFSERLPFQIDLVKILADQLDEVLPEALLDVVGGFVDASGSGTLVFDPLLRIGFGFGIDLSALLATPTQLASVATQLAGLATVSNVVFHKTGASDLRVMWRDGETDARTVDIDLSGAATLGDIVDRIDTTLKAEIGPTVSFGFDAATGQVTLADSDSEIIVDDGVTALFGAASAQSVDAGGRQQISLDGGLDPAAGGTFSLTIGGKTTVLTLAAESGRDRAGFVADFNALLASTAVSRAVLSPTAIDLSLVSGDTPSASVSQPSVLALDSLRVTDAAEALSLTVPVAGGSVEVSVAAEAGRDETALIAALNDAIAVALADRGLLAGGAIPGVTVNLVQLMTLVDDAGTLALRTTNYTEAAGYTPLAFSVSGEDRSKDISFELESQGGSNVVRLLGLGGASGAVDDAIVSEALYEAEDIGAPRVFIDTANTGIRAEFEAGVSEGLELSLGFGPVQFFVENGKVLINAGDGTGAPAFLDFGVNDIDGDDRDGEYDVAHLFALRTDRDAGFADLFDLDVGIGLDVALPFSDSLGAFDPTQHGLYWTTALVESVDGAHWSDFDASDITVTFSGDLPSIFAGEGINLDNFRLDLPDLGDVLANFDVLALLNDPKLVLGGIDTLFGQVQSIFDDYLADIELPIIGDAIGTGVSFFNDVRYSVLLPALEFAETPQDDGSLPTTVDLLTGFLNTQLNDVLGTDSVAYVQAHLETGGAGNAQNAYVYGALNFSGIIFDEMLDVDFDFGIPGFNIEVERGSQILMQLDYTVNIGFGFDRNGFFLLNDTDEAEVSIDFTVDAGSFEGSMSVLNLLGLDARAVTLDADGNVVSSAGSGGGTALLTAFLEADLYGDAGIDLATSGRSFDMVSPLDGAGNLLTYETSLHLNQINFGSLIIFDFGATVDVAIGLEGNVLNPFDGEPITFNGSQILPSVMSELVFSGGYTLQGGLALDQLGFQNVRVDASTLYESLIAPLADPILDVVKPFLDAMDIVFQPPLELIKNAAVDLFSLWFPIIRKVDNVAEVANSMAQFAADLSELGGMVHFGSFDFSSRTDDMASGATTFSQIDLASVPKVGDFTGAGKPDFGVFGNERRGFSVEIPLIRDPFSAMGLLMGNFGDVELARARYTLFNVDMDDLDFTRLLLDEIDGLPGWAKDRLSESPSLVGTKLSGSGVTKFEVGYDLLGLENFINSYDPLRLIDGVFIEARPGSLIDLDLTYTIMLKALLTGIEGSGSLDFDLSLNDPNNDGKLRLSEIVDVLGAIVDELDDPISAVQYLFEGSATFGLGAAAFFGPFDLEIFDLELPTINFGKDLPPSMATNADGGTAIMNVGSRVVSALTDIQEDGDDRITVAAGTAALSNAQGSFDGALDGHDALVVPAGEGDNVVDLGGYDADGKVTITYSGAGTDTITLPKAGMNVVFSGGGNDIISAPAGASGTYVVFGGGGAEKIDIPGGNVIVLADDDFGMRDRFLTEFASGNVSADRVCALLGLNETGEVDAAADAFYDTGAGLQNLAGLIESYTEITQSKAGRDAETIRVGDGNHVIFTGRGADSIQISPAGSGVVNVLSGDGDDTVLAAGRYVFVEAGAGSDRVEVSGALTEVWGWGKAAGDAGQVGRAAQLDSLAQKDGADILIGGSGADSLFGQLGRDLLEGNGGNDSLGGGIDLDIVTGGTFDITGTDGGAIALADIDIGRTLPKGLLISLMDFGDGNDTLSGGAGDDVLIGGGGRDTVQGNAGRDIVAGDFVQVELSRNLIVKDLVSNFVDSSNQGMDSLVGGAMDDILVGGGAEAGTRETLLDVLGNNLLIGDFGDLDGPRILEFQDKVTSIDAVNGGDDALTTGRGNDQLVGGEGDDHLTSGLGADILFGDNAVLDYAAKLFTGRTLDTDGNELISTGRDTPGSGGPPEPVDLRDIVVGGLGDDSLTAGTGGVVFAGDGATIALNTAALEALRTYLPLGDAPTPKEQADHARALQLIDVLARETVTTPDARDGDDRLDVAGGVNLGFLGGGNDHAELRDGVNYVYGDDGRLILAEDTDGSGLRIAMASQAAVSAQVTDTFNAGDGNNMMAGGEGGDSITAGDGFNAILGDAGTYASSHGRSWGHIGSDASLSGSGDSITTGTGRSMIVAGQGDDTVRPGDGDDFATGDDARMTHSDGWQVQSVTTLNHASGGRDLLDAAGTRGDNMMMGQTGDDTLDGGLDDDVLVGDNADQETTEALDALAGQSPVDRLVRIESLEIRVDGDDELRGASGTDYLIGGFGEETLWGGAGQDFLIGDTAVLTREYTDEGSGVFGEMTIDTNFAYETGGYDLLHGEAGFDVMIGNLGPDLFFGDTAEDALFSDGFAGWFETDWGAGYFNDPTPHWELVRVNFAGPSAIDVVSSAQSAASIGLSLNRFVSTSGHAGEESSAGDIAIFEGADGAVPVDAALLSDILDHLGSDAILEAVGVLFAGGADRELVAAALQASIAELLSETVDLDAVTFELIVMQIIEALMARMSAETTSADAAAPAGEAFAMAAE